MLRKYEEIKKDDTKKSTIADRCACVLWRGLLCMMIGSNCSTGVWSTLNQEVVF